MVDPSPWPLAGACSAFVITTGLVIWFHEKNLSLLCFGFLMFCLTCFC